MKRIAVLAALTLLALGFSAPRATAQIACISYPGFCDRAELEVKSGRLLGGFYDFDCSDSFSLTVSGVIRAGHATLVGTSPFDPGTMQIADHNLETGRHDLWEWNGFTISPVRLDVPFTGRPGACSPLALDGLRDRRGAVRNN